MRHLSSKMRKTKRITISIEEGIEEKISQLQIHLSDIANEEWSLSKTINMLLLCGILSQGSLSVVNLGKIRGFSDGTKIRLNDIEMDAFVTSLVALKQSYKF